MKANEASNDRQVVFVSLEPWDEVWRRNQFVCRELTRRRWEILFVEPAADWSAGLRRGDRAQFERRPMWSPRELEGLAGRVWVTRPVKAAPKTTRTGRVVNAGLLRRHLARRLQTLGWRRPALWINDQRAVCLTGGAMDWSRVLYDVTDDWGSGLAASRFQRQVILDDESLCRVADVVVVCSERLEEMKQPLARQVELVPNGVDVEAYCRDEEVEMPAATEAWQGPVLGYTGTLHSERLDLALLESLANKWPGTIAMVGPDHLSDEDRRRLDAVGIVRTGPKAFAELPGWMAKMDVMIVPHRVSGFTESLNPLKLWEYLAFGRPIVSTPVAGFRSFPEHVRLASDAERFFESCQCAVNEAASAKQRRRLLAMEHGWEARVDRIEPLLQPRSSAASSAVGGVEQRLA